MPCEFTIDISTFPTMLSPKRTWSGREYDAGLVQALVALRTHELVRGAGGADIMPRLIEVLPFFGQFSKILV